MLQEIDTLMEAFLAILRVGWRGLAEKAFATKEKV